MNYGLSFLTPCDAAGSIRATIPEIEEAAVDLAISIARGVPIIDLERIRAKILALRRRVAVLPVSEPVRRVDIRRHRAVDVRRSLGLSPDAFERLLLDLGIVLEDRMVPLEVVGRLEAELNRRRRIAAGMRG